MAVGDRRRSLRRFAVAARGRDFYSGAIHPEVAMNHRSLPVSLVVVGALLSALAIVATSAHAQAPAAPAPGCIQVEVQNVRPEQGTLMVAAYDDAAAFASKAPAAATQLRAGTATMRFSLCGLAGTTVALTLYQDLNGNGKLDSNAFGMPTEPWGASGRPAAMTAPTWESTAVPVDGTTVVVPLSK
jgi:uncharacterized protein (DUF2141 family)